jgi:hypothetical protein
MASKRRDKHTRIILVQGKKKPSLGYPPVFFHSTISPVRIDTSQLSLSLQHLWVIRCSTLLVVERKNPCASCQGCQGCEGCAALGQAVCTSKSVMVLIAFASNLGHAFML